MLVGRGALLLRKLLHVGRCQCRHPRSALRGRGRGRGTSVRPQWSTIVQQKPIGIKCRVSFYPTT